jgi:hypothetical protein
LNAASQRLETLSKSLTEKQAASSVDIGPRRS